MPKIIDNLKDTILEEARKQVFTNGYASTTMRSVADGCGVAVGTLYNYFPSKAMMVASFMLKDWQTTLETMSRCCDEAQDISEAILCVHSELRAYIAGHEPVLQGEESELSLVFRQRHRMLRDQISEVLRPVCLRCAKTPSDFLPEFVAEAVLDWTNDGGDFAPVNNILRELFQ